MQGMHLPIGWEGYICGQQGEVCTCGSERMYGDNVQLRDSYCFLLALSRNSQINKRPKLMSLVSGRSLPTLENWFL